MKFTSDSHYGRKEDVAPLAGAWIEIQFREYAEADTSVAPLAGAWIEIKVVSAVPWSTWGRSPCGSVD